MKKTLFDVKYQSVGFANRSEWQIDMKNIIPLVVSVILGLAAVYLVSKLLFENKNADLENKVSVVVAARDLNAHDELSQGSLTYKDIPESAVPRNALRWENVSLAYGQQLPHAVSRDDYILMTDIRIQTTLSDCTRQGEWTVPVTFSDPALVKEVKRHPPERRENQTRYARPLKVLCRSKEERNLVYMAIVRLRNQFLPKGAYVRSDLTPLQLKKDTRLRSLCRIWNDELGRKRFLVKNLEIVDLDNDIRGFPLTVAR